MVTMELRTGPEARSSQRVDNRLEKSCPSFYERLDIKISSGNKTSQEAELGIPHRQAIVTQLQLNIAGGALFAAHISPVRLTGLG